MKAETGTVLCERSREFLAWRFIRCPGVRYHVFVAIDSQKSVKGLLVVRVTKKRHVPITVLVDFLVDHTVPGVDSIAQTLLKQAYRLAWRYFSPLVVALVNPFSVEAGILSRNGFKVLPKAILPHDSNFILRLNRELPNDLNDKLSDFNRWYFSFADYDIF